MTLLINNRAVQGQGPMLTSLMPYNSEVLWAGHEATPAQVAMATQAARDSFPAWRDLPFTCRLTVVERFAEKIAQQSAHFAVAIAKETGKPLWEAKTEVTAMIGKITLSHQAYLERTGERRKTTDQLITKLSHRPLGVLAVLGPYNFPAHLPNGHIVPALLAGNTLVFKPSELTPYVAELMTACWIEAGIPPGVINLIQGGGDVGEALTRSSEINGILFTGSAKTGHQLHQYFGGQPEKMLALEMGGNNPLIVSTHFDDVEACLNIILQSAFITSGQRCTCARRLFVPQGEKGDVLIERLVSMASSLLVDEPFADTPPFMGTMISISAVKQLLNAKSKLEQLGARVLLSGQQLGHAFITPIILDVTNVMALPDEEYFGPLLQVIRYASFSEAIEKANHTRFGLSAGLISNDDNEWQQFYTQAQAGIVNRNRPLTGASGDAPFGGIGASGNLRPSAYYAADYCAYPVATMEENTPQPVLSWLPGMKSSSSKGDDDV